MHFTDCLYELEKDGLVVRIEFDEQPPHVEYELSPLGLSFAPAMHELCVWGTQHYPSVIWRYGKLNHLGRI